MQKKRQAESKPKVVQLTPVASVFELLPGANLHAFGVGPDKSVLFAGATEFRLTANGGKTPESYRIVQLTEGIVTLDVTINDAPGHVGHIQIVGDELLLCVWGVNFAQPDRGNNGRFYTLEGKPTRSIFVGHLAKDIQSTEDGMLWVIFADDNVFRGANSGNPVGDVGIVVWDTRGRKMYPDSIVSDLLNVHWGNALNIASDKDIWLYYEPDSSLVLLHGEKIMERWTIPIAEGQAFAISYRHALFQGHSIEQTTSGIYHYHLYQLENSGAVRQLDFFTLLNEVGNPLKIDHIVGRGDTLYLIADGSLYTLSLWEVLVAHREN